MITFIIINKHLVVVNKLEFWNLNDYDGRAYWYLSTITLGDKIILKFESNLTVCKNNADCRTYSKTKCLVS